MGNLFLLARALQGSELGLKRSRVLAWILVKSIEVAIIFLFLLWRYIVSFLLVWVCQRLLTPALQTHFKALKLLHIIIDAKFFHIFLEILPDKAFRIRGISALLEDSVSLDSVTRGP